ncbi:hypothetical protein NO1_2131, partial [Candidatus Termititenax aidoneus]
PENCNDKQQKINPRTFLNIEKTPTEVFSKIIFSQSCLEKIFLADALIEKGGV